MTPPGEDPAAGAAQSEEVVELSAGEALSFALQLHDTGFFDDAETLYRRILESFPDYPDALHFLGLLCHERGRHSEAVELLERIVAILPENADAHNSLGNALMPLERYAESEACYRKAIALDAGHAQAHNNLGVIFSAQDRHLEAVEAYRTAVDLKPDRADFRCNLGRALRRSGLKVEAISAFAEAIVLDPENVGNWQELALTLILRNLEDRRDEVVPSLSKLSRLSPGNPLAGYWRAACLGENVPPMAPRLFIENTFDKMAKGFDKLLTGHLDYRAPDLVIEALAAVLPAPARNLDILDAGCGTGLCGPLLRPYARGLTGVDLSSKMLELAGERQTYDSLVKAELSDFLGDNPATCERHCLGRHTLLLRSAGDGFRECIQGAEGGRLLCFHPRGRAGASRGLAPQSQRPLCPLIVLCRGRAQEGGVHRHSNAKRRPAKRGRHARAWTPRNCAEKTTRLIYL